MTQPKDSTTGERAMNATTNDTLTMDGCMWAVTGVFLGPSGGESVIGLQVIGERFDASAYGKTLPELFVPEILIRRAVEAGLITVTPGASQ
jgi:hypothetical protein